TSNAIRLSVGLLETVASDGCVLRKAMEKSDKPIRSFHDLEVYQISYQAMLEVFQNILPKLPKEEQYDLTDQLRRAVKAIPRLIAEGHSKRHQKRGFQKYIDDAMTESNETIVSLSQTRDLYAKFVDVAICERLIDVYDKVSRQLYNLSLAWTKFGDRSAKRNREPDDDSSCATV
ncbi:MAG: four helix bundle protein, partial [bacterium]